MHMISTHRSVEMDTLQTITFLLAVCFSISAPASAMNPEEMNECERGVRRHHPSQANLYQIFTRQDHQSRWMDYECPDNKVFDRVECECAEPSSRPEPPRHEPQRPQWQRSEPARHPSRYTKDDGVDRDRHGQDRYQDGEKHQDSWRDEDRGRQEDRGRHEDRGRGEDRGRHVQETDRYQDSGRHEDRGRMDEKERHEDRGRMEDKERYEDRETPHLYNNNNNHNSNNNNNENNHNSNRRWNDPPQNERSHDEGAQDWQAQPQHRSRPSTDQEMRKEGPRESKGRPDTNCHLHRPSGEPSHFERWSDGQWVQEDCNWPFYTGLIWSQEECRCEWGPNRTVVTSWAGDSVPAECLMMLKVTFDEGQIKDDGRHIWLNVLNKESASVETDNTAVGGYSGFFRGSSIVVPYFKSNVLGAVFHIGLMFKLCPGDPDTDIPLLHNDCMETAEGPGIMVTYQAWKKQITISMRTINNDHLESEYCSVGVPQTQWSKLDIRYDDGWLEVKVNDNTCVESEKYYGPVATNNCPLSLLGEEFCGNLDEVIVTRGCTEAHAVS